MGAEKIDCRLDLRGKVCPGPTFDTRMTLNEKEVTISLVPDHDVLSHGNLIPLSCWPTLWLTGARKEAKPTEARPVEPRVRPDRVRCRA